MSNNRVWWVVGILAIIVLVLVIFTFFVDVRGM